jgi:hypothetical protein
MRFKNISILPDDRIHMTNKRQLSFKDQNPSAKDDAGKPTGLWYGLGKSWFDYHNEAAREAFYKHIYKIEINPEKILFLNTPEKVLLFTKEYSEKPWFWGPGNPNLEPNWNKVSKKYSGVEFNPYFSNLKFEKMYGTFYRYLSVPSGCIWDSKGIKNIQKIN